MCSNVDYVNVWEEVEMDHEAQRNVGVQGLMSSYKGNKSRTL